jgi:predicted nucleic acid-binding Zn ribbon protein
MKKKLLLLSLVVYATISSAQTKIWDFGNDTTTWPLSAGIGLSEMVVDNLGLFPIPTNTNFGAVTANTYTFTADGFTAVNRFQLNGGGSAGTSFLPTQRYLYFTATGACTVKIWFRTGGSGSRNMFITDGTSLIATAGSSTSGDGIILTGNVSAAQAAAGKIYIYADQSCNLYKLEVTGATVNTTLSSESFQSELKADVFTNNNQVSVSNITEATEINVYSITGQLVKSLNTSTDVDFELNASGFYIVNMKSSEGKKSVKIALN